MKPGIALIKAAFGLSGITPVNGASTDCGSSICRPAMTFSPFLKSPTDLAMGPSVRKAPDIPMSTGSIEFTKGSLPILGFNEAMPQQYAGLRREPPISLPNPNGLIPVAIAAPSPPLEPPGVSFLFHGLNVLPLKGLSVSKRIPNSGKLVLPIGIAPAANILSTMGAFLGGIASAIRGIPFVVGVPIRSIFSLIVKGTP